MKPHTVVTPRPSATVILARPAWKKFEILLIRRSQKSSFMGGFCAFPGGSVEPDDFQEPFRPAGAVGALPLLPAQLSPDEQRALFVCGARELLEEAGVLLAYDASGRWLPGADSTQSVRLQQEINTGGSFCALLNSYGYRLSLKLLHPYTHWITPKALPKRFDTYFFVASVPNGTPATVDEKETTSAFWFTAEGALTAHREGSIDLSPPTLKIIYQLASYPDIQSLVDSLKKPDLDPILPVFCAREEGNIIVLPSDPDYLIAPHGMTTEGQRPVLFQEEPTRLVWNSGRWTLYLVER